MVTLLVVGYSLAYLMNPLLTRLEKKGVSRPVGIFAIGSVVAIAISLLLITVLPPLVREFSNLTRNLPVYVDTAREKVGPLLDRLRMKVPALNRLNLGDDVSTQIQGSGLLSGESVQKIVRGLGEALLQGYNITLTVVNLALLPFIVYYLAVDFSMLHRRGLNLLPRSYQPGAKQIFIEIDGYVSAFVRAQLLVASILFALYAAGLGIVGVELWFVLALIAGFGNLVPYLGSLVGVVLATVMTLVTFGDFYHLFQVWGVFAIVQFLEGSIISPRIVGDQVGISPLVVILAIFAGGQLFGLLGVVLAVPGAAIIKVLGNHLHRQVVASV